MKYKIILLFALIICTSTQSLRVSVPTANPTVMQAATVFYQNYLVAMGLVPVEPALQEYADQVKQGAAMSVMQNAQILQNAEIMNIVVQTTSGPLQLNVNALRQQVEARYP